MTSDVTDVLQAVQSFIAKGYDREYRVKDGKLVDLDPAVRSTAAAR